MDGYETTHFLKSHKKSTFPKKSTLLLVVGGGGFEPPKS